MPKIFFIGLLSFGVLSLQAQEHLSDTARVSVITCGPWQGELYSAFGHSAIHVYDPAQKVDYVYNYGVFDFNQPHFYLNFARGFLRYQLGVYYYRDFLNYYISYNRFVHEQVLNLTQEQKQNLFDYLQWNAEPENQYYQYDYYYNNCATKIRDVVKEVLHDQVTFDLSYIQTDYSLRELTHIYLLHQPWGELGIDICLGEEIDKPTPPFTYMFLPDYIESSFDHAAIIKNGNTAPLVLEKRIPFKGAPESYPFDFFQPLIVFSILMLIIIGLTIWDFKRKKSTGWLDYVLLGVTGLLGLLLFFLWTATDHKSAMNFNLLWAVPANLIAIIGLARNAQWTKKYFIVIAAISVLTLVTWPILPQQLNYSLIPIVFALAVRWGFNGWLRRYPTVAQG